MLFRSFGFFSDSGQARPESVNNAGEAPLNMLLAMGLGASLCIAIGVWPQGLYALLPYGGDYWPYEMGHVVTQMQLLFFATLDRKSTRLNSSHVAISYAVFCLKKKRTH